MSHTETIEKEADARRRGRPPKGADAADTKRIAFPQTLLDAIDALRDKTGASTSTDVFRDAIRAYAYLCEAHMNGKEIVIRDPSGSEKVLALFMPLPPKA